ncbi:NADPH-dependent FMN reductase [Cesiribacter sp. SM1]|uniref:NADPH-dependent FMN reductase n=1 Tax=Cesiribacter sp. SM1 TaxID=2861196 RepID=UPI001CD39D10|nr:NAD(P)H-dependent oxidoreductase [Cesiribacter sp. SM1]
MYKLKIISSTVRPGRKGPKIAAWVADTVRRDGRFQVEVLDLGDTNLPLMNEAAHPVLKQYEHEHTKRWSEKIEEADAFIFVTAEYNFGYPSALRNALEYLVQEWAYKAAGIVSYGGVSAGTRAANSLRADLTTLRVVPVYEMVNLPFFAQFINDLQEFVPSEVTQKAAEAMLNELFRWTKGMKLIKENKETALNTLGV